MSNSLDCPGLRASSVLAWLAAVGATVLDRRLRLHWTTDATPFAVLSSDEVDPLDALLGAWPDDALLDDMPIAERWRQADAIGRKVPVDSFRERARMARKHPYSWTLSSTMTDLLISDDGEVAHGPFDPSGPGTIKWLHHRLLKLHRTLAPSAERLRDSLLGQAARVPDNGLGFDHARLGSLADKTAPWVDPVIEMLAFFGLSLFPVRGDGDDVRLGTRHQRDRRLRDVAKTGFRQRGWHWVVDEKGTAIPRFVWPAWRQPLDSPGIDALLDAWRLDRLNRRAGWKLLGIHAWWRTVWYEAQGSNDPTKAYGSERLCAPSR